MEELNRREAILAAIAAGLMPVICPEAAAPAREVPADDVGASDGSDDENLLADLIITN